MARKFRNGDKVKVVKECGPCEFEEGVRIGNVGIVVDYDAGVLYPYRVKLQKNGEVYVFGVRELELIKRKGD